MKRSTAWVSITLLVMFLSLLLIPISHAKRSGRGGAIRDAGKQPEAGGLDLKRMAKLSPAATLPRAQSDKKLTPISAQAVRFAVSDPVRSLAAARMQTDRRVKGEGSAGAEKNELNALEVKTQKPEAANLASIDGALRVAKPIESETPSVPSLTFDGLSDADNDILIGGRVAPSDENIDVGPNDVVQTVNDGFRVWDKNGNARIPPTLISSLFSKLGGDCANHDDGDPVVLYDRMADRWFITQFAFQDQFNPPPPPYHQCVAVSQNGDPTGVYYTYDFVTVGAEFPDYGKFGVWPDGYYMTVNQFTNGGPFNGVGAYALDRQKMLVGDPTASFIYFNLNLTSNPEGIFAMQPSDQDGLEAPPAGAANVFAYLISDEFESPPFNVDALRLFNFHADFATPANSTFSERSESPVHVAAFDPRTSPGRSDVKQPAPAAGTDSLDSIEYHLMFRMQYWNRGGIETLVSSTTVNTSGVAPTNRTLYQAGVRYFELQRSTPGGPFLLYDNATFSPDAGNPATGVNRWLPSAAIDHQGNLAVSYSTSSTSVFPSIWYAGRDFNALGGLTGEQHLFDGTAVQLGSANRWGDYQSLQVDPSDDCSFWTTNQYYNVNSSFNWRTRIGRFKFPTCAAPAQGTLSGTVTACDSGVPLSGAIVQLSNGFSTTTKANGTYSFNVEPGTYSATVSANINRDCTPTAGSIVTVNDGSTTNFDVCLSGTANPVVDTTNPSAVVVSGGNGNAIIDPDECNNLTVRLDNLGCAVATNVTTTLASSTPGVTITQSHSPYPDLPIDGNGNNLVPYSVSTAPGFVCGTPIQFTLTVNFTGGSTVSTFTLPTCSETQPPATVNGSLDPADPDSTQGRIGRNGVTNLCGTPKACPGGLGTGGRSFDQLSFVNSGPLDACATISLTSAGGINLIGSAYLNSYNPADTTFCNNYLGDPGGSANGTVSWEATIPAGQTLVVVVMEVNAGTAATPYSVTVSGLSAPAPAGGGVCQPLEFGSPTLTVSEGGDAAQLVINRGGSSAGTATVDYATSDGTAKQLGDYTIKLGTLTFADGETSKTLLVPIVDDAYVEGNETFTVTLSNATGAGSLGNNTTTVVTITDNDTSPGTNPIDVAGFFVRQHYLDFLNRLPDTPGLNFWTNQITGCGSDASCIAAKRESVSAAFFLSIEFQETGAFAIRTHRAAFGRMSVDPATRVSYAELIRSQSQLNDGVVIGQPGADAALEANKQAYALAVVNSAAFITRYAAATTDSAFVDALFASADVTPTASERANAIAAYDAQGTVPLARTAALRSVTDSNSVRTAEFNAAFVLMEYFGYLRRNPTDAPDVDDSGYQFWLAKLNSFGGDFRRSDMVKAFITSTEYRLRFGP
jgi:hypothetical protein